MADNKSEEYIKVLEAKIKALEVENAEKDETIKRLSLKADAPAADAAAPPAAVEITDENREFVCYDDDACLGKACPSFESLEFHNGDAVKIGDGKVTVVTFFSKLNKSDFSTLSRLSDVAEKYGDKIHVVGISRDAESRDVSRWFEKFQDKFFAELSGPSGEAGVLVKAHFPLAFDAEGKVNAMFKEVAMKAVVGVGFTYIVDGAGTIRWCEIFVRGNNPMGQFDAQLENIVNGKPLLSNGNAPAVAEEELDDGGVVMDDPFEAGGDGY